MKTKIATMVSVLTLSVCLVFTSLILNAQTMSISPDMINLNAQGSWDKVQCHYGFYLPSGYSVSAHNVAVYFGGNYVANAYNVWYCVIDSKLFVYVDRAAVQSSPAVHTLAGLGPIVVTISGTFTASNSQGNSIQYTVDRWGYATILKPGQKK